MLFTEQFSMITSALGHLFGFKRQNNEQLRKCSAHGSLKPSFDHYYLSAVNVGSPCIAQHRLPWVVYVGTQPSCFNSLRAATRQLSDMVKWTHYGPFSQLALPLTLCWLHKWQLIITVHDSDVWIIRLEWLNMERHLHFQGWTILFAQLNQLNLTVFLFYLFIFFPRFFQLECTK